MNLLKTDNLVSVIIPAYNNAGFIANAIESVLAQTYKEIEIIVIDDGSTDNTKEILSSYIKMKQIKYIYQENRGSASARNQGILSTQGGYIAFLDADDYWEKDKIDAQMEYLKSSNSDLVYCDKVIVDENGNVLINEYEQVLFEEGNIFVPLFKGNLISTASCVLLKRSCFKTVGLFNEKTELRNCQDYDMWLRIAAKYRIGVIRRKLLRYRVHSGNKTKAFQSRFIGMETVLNSSKSSDGWMSVTKEQKERIVKGRMVQLYRSYFRTFVYIKDREYACILFKKLIKMGWASLNVFDLVWIGRFLLPEKLFRIFHMLLKRERVQI